MASLHIHTRITQLYMFMSRSWYRVGAIARTCVHTHISRSSDPTDLWSLVQMLPWLLSAVLCLLLFFSHLIYSATPLLGTDHNPLTTLFLPLPSHTHPPTPYSELARNDQEDDYDDIFGTAPEDAGGPEFNLVLVNLNDMVNRSSFFTLAHYLCTLRCPDGTPFLDPELIHTRKTIDSILLPLLLQSYISSRDLDLLIHVFEIMNREDVIKMLKDHLAKVTMGGPRERRLKDTKRNFNVRCVVEKGVGLNIQKVVTIKKKLLSLFRLEDYPFIIQYVGWRTRPLSLTYQMPQACMQTVKESITGSPIVLKEEKIRRVVVSIGTAKFLYNFI